MNAVRRFPAALALLVLASAGGRAAAETRVLKADQLVLTSMAEADIAIATDGPPGSVQMSADGSLSCLMATGGQTAVVNTAACGAGLESLRITVSPTTPVTLTVNGDGTIKIGNLRALLTATLFGGADLQAGDVGGLILTMRGGGDASVGAVDGASSLQMAGGGDVHLGELTGALSVKNTGSGDLAIAGMNATVADIENNGSGDVTIGSGRIGNLHARTYGSGDVTIAAVAVNADVAASGGGDIKLAQVTGTLARSAAAGSDITVGGSPRVKVTSGRAAAASRSGRGVLAQTPAIVVHLVMAALVALMLFLIWRTVRRSRGLARSPARPLHPGVVAVGQTMARLDQRLGRLEGYVTTREFDLNRKFRDLK